MWRTPVKANALGEGNTPTSLCNSDGTNGNGQLQCVQSCDPFEVRFPAGVNL